MHKQPSAVLAALCLAACCLAAIPATASPAAPVHSAGESGIVVTSLFSGRIELLHASDVVRDSPLSGAARADEVTEIAAGEPVTGRLESTDPMLDDGTHYDVYRYAGRAGEQISITMRSEEFDTYLSLRLEDGTIIEEDDDNAGGTDARIITELPDDGVYLVYANALFETGTGAYTLALETGTDLGSTVRGILSHDSAAHYPTLELGQGVGGALTTATPLLAEQGTPYQAWRFSATGGEAIDFAMRSEYFDAYLRVGGVGDAEILAENDDGGEGMNSLLTFDVPEDGDYVVVASSFRGGAEGPFTLEMSRAAPTVSGASILRDWLPGAPRIRAGQRLDGMLDDRSPLMDDRSHFQIYSFQGEAGERITIKLDSDDFDAFLGLLRTDDGVNPLWEQDDDSGQGTNAQITVDVPADGVYGIVVNTLRPRSTGSFTLEVIEGDALDPVLSNEQIFSPMLAAAAHPVRAGLEVVGILDDASATLEDGSPVQLWRYRARAGERISVSMRSEDFDTYLQAGFINDPTSRRSNDDAGPETTNSRIVIEVDRDGELVIVANSFSEGARGSYTLVVERE